MRSRIDLDALRSAVSVVNLLATLRIVLRNFRCACPIHGGDNATAFAVSQDGTKFYCHVCGVGGDVFRLAECLYGCGFREAVAYVAAVAGLDSGRLPQLDREAAEDRATVARRRAALARWRTRRLTALAVELHQLDDDVAWYAALLARDAGMPNEAVWQRGLADTFVAVEAAELQVATLGVLPDDAALAESWLDEMEAVA